MRAEAMLNGDGDTAIRTVDLTKSYGSLSAPVHALRGVSVTINRSERVALLGRSGSGKSTLLNLIGGLDHPSAGSVFVAGRDLAQMGGRELAQHRMTGVGMIFQSFNLILSRTALENVELPMIFAGRVPHERRLAAQEILHDVGLGDRLHHRPGQLSGGEHQRVAIARALVNDPKILLADEPTGNLDTATAEEVLHVLMHHVRERQMTLVLVTHDEQVAARAADRVFRLQDGRLIV